MQLSALSREAGVPIATIKFYLRERLLPPGTAPTGGHAEYGPAHLRRLRLIRALVQVGDLSLASVAGILAAVDDPDVSVHAAIGVAHRAIAARAIADADPDDAAIDARADVDRFLGGLGWSVSADAPDRDALASALRTLRDLGWTVDADVFGRYATAADRLARWELTRMPDGIDRELAVENAVVGTVVFGAAFAALRRLAEERHSAARFAR
jgi:DNA-binding transcriptional MerR regulator